MQLDIKTQVTPLAHHARDTVRRHGFCLTKLYELAGRVQRQFLRAVSRVMYRASSLRLRGLDRFASVLNLSSA